MKIQEIMRSVSFDEVAEILSRDYPEMEHNLMAFYEAFHILRLMEPASEESDCVLEISREYDGEKPYISCRFCDGGDWPLQLTKDVVLKDGLELSVGEVAAHILWEMTFYGNTPEMIERTFREMMPDFVSSNPYRQQADRLLQTQTDHLLPKHLKGNKTIPEEYCELFHPKRRNRSKRKREYRQDKRIEQLEELAHVHDAVCRFLNECRTERKSDYEHFYKAANCFIRHCQTRSENPDGRVDFLLDGLTKYEHFAERIAKHEDVRLAVLFTTAAKYPLTAEERQRLEDYFNKVSTMETRIVYGTVNDDAPSDAEDQIGKNLKWLALLEFSK